ncbi:unnamed protein product [Nippostrongylus brasiliensis]|uniref:N-acetyltransferase domain-containing protein n=1 Tax=Nippostrongylus brasiliensis TaxID=27835 RepID=A0A0N4Y534_NIPBR|nr:unnamed protein product [Nippostrongylus brasiliensis]
MNKVDLWQDHSDQKKLDGRWGTSMPTSDLVYSVATRQHAAEIEKFLREEFRINEPITSSIGATDADVADLFHGIAESGYGSEKYSMVVYKNTRRKYRFLPQHYVLHCKEVLLLVRLEIANGPYRQHKSNQIAVLLDVIESKQVVLLGNGSKVFKCDVLCVSRAARGQGIAKRLTEMAIDTARREGCDWMASDATAVASQNLLAKYGFKTLLEIPYSNYLDNGEVVFKNLPDGGKSAKFIALSLKD